MAKKLWSSTSNPPNHVATSLNITRIELGAALHAIKQAWGLGGADDVTIWDDGTVTDDRGDVIGNIYDEI